MLQLAVSEIEKEQAAKEVEKQNYLAEHCPPLSLPGSMQELQVKTSLSLSLCQRRKDLAPSVNLVDLGLSHLDLLLTFGGPGAGWMWNWPVRQLGCLCEKEKGSGWQESCVSNNMLRQHLPEAISMETGSWPASHTSPSGLGPIWSSGLWSFRARAVRRE